MYFYMNLYRLANYKFTLIPVNYYFFENITVFVDLLALMASSNFYLVGLERKFFTNLREKKKKYLFRVWNYFRKIKTDIRMVVRFEYLRWLLAASQRWLVNLK